MTALTACGDPSKHGPHEECVGIPLPPIASVPPMPLDDATARELAKAAKNAATWTEKRNALIRDALAAGGGVREVARATNLAPATVLNIQKPRRRRQQ